MRRRIRRAGFIFGAGLLGLLGIAAGLGCCAFSSPGYTGPRSDHFDGEEFHNQDPQEPHGFFDFLKWQIEREPGPWRDFVNAPPGPRPIDRVGRGELRVTFVNHATTLIQMDGLNILTDPVWSDVVGPALDVGPRRVRPPGIRYEDLPPIDVVLVSHNHYDHMDLPTLRRLAADHKPKIFAGLGSRVLLHGEGVDGTEDLDWWQVADLAPEVRVTGVPATHFSNRGFCDRNNTLWMGFVVSGPAGLVYFAGDTGFGKHFQQIRERFGAIRLAILPIGAYLPRWFMSPVHIDPAEAVEAHRTLGAATSLGMHFGTFRLADEGQDDPPLELGKALEKAGGGRFWVLGFGEGRDVPPIAAAPP
ncbi:MAG: MBL fold metallo-hydrolase [Polyangiaceae bacterium]|nr:MBL fold metallo-hydrolase [Polyangiaceae bacterium]